MSANVAEALPGRQGVEQRLHHGVRHSLRVVSAVEPALREPRSQDVVNDGDARIVPARIAAGRYQELKIDVAVRDESLADPVEAGREPAEPPGKHPPYPNIPPS